MGLDVWRLLEVVIAVGAIMIPLWVSDRRERHKQHKENSEKLEMLLDEQEERPAHAHVETSGNLTAEGIRYKPRRANGRV